MPRSPPGRRKWGTTAHRRIRDDAEGPCRPGSAAARGRRSCARRRPRPGTAGGVQDDAARHRCRAASLQLAHGGHGGRTRDRTGRPAHRGARSEGRDRVGQRARGRSELGGAPVRRRSPAGRDALHVDRHGLDVERRSPDRDLVVRDGPDGSLTHVAGMGGREVDRRRQRRPRAVCALPRGLRPVVCRDDSGGQHTRELRVRGQRLAADGSPQEHLAAREPQGRQLHHAGTRRHGCDQRGRWRRQAARLPRGLQDHRLARDTLPYVQRVSRRHQHRQCPPAARDCGAQRVRADHRVDRRQDVVHGCAGTCRAGRRVRPPVAAERREPEPDRPGR